MLLSTPIFFLAKQLTDIGNLEGEKVWRMPICEKFDKMIDTPNADMKNIGGRYAGSSTAAQFLQRFANNVPWVHLDIAGTAMGSPKTAISKSWASGYGPCRASADHAAYAVPGAGAGGSNS